MTLHPIVAITFASATLMLPPGLAAQPVTTASPNGRLVVEFRMTEDGAPRYAVRLDGRPVLQASRLGLVRDDADFSRGLQLVSAAAIEAVDERYEILTAKRRTNHYRANRRVFHLQTSSGQKMDVIFQVSDDGVAFRYAFPDRSTDVRRLKDEMSSFHVLPGTRAWMQPVAKAKSGWMETNPSYEELYEKEIPAGTPSPTGAGWVYPALFRSGDVWLVVSESALSRDYAGSRLRSEAPDGEYRVGFPDPRESFKGGPVNPESTLPWMTPWRVIAIGSLAAVTESMLGVDVADRPAQPATSGIRPGKASWSWPLLKDPGTVFDIQKRFIDYAAEMGWGYCLIDALWDTQIGYEKVEELVRYARGKNVGILLWYNSAGDWNGAPQTPRDRMLTRESRRQEFTRLKEMGVAGLKIDFFGGDGQSMIAYYIDILEDAAPYGFMLNFHGATLPRGWQRKYPHLMTMEGVRGLEYATFEQRDADRIPSHAAMLPFTRNIFDPMDFTPMVLDRIPRIERRTTSAFELATTILFTSGIQHYAETPEGMAKAPAYVRDLLKGLPSVWDDVKFVDGYPGRFVVLARSSGGRWYVAGINGGSDARRVTIDPGLLGARGTATLIGDGKNDSLSFRRETIDLAAPGGKLEITMPPRGGFVLVQDAAGSERGDPRRVR